MAENATPDLARMVSTVLENPDLVAGIREMIAGKEKTEGSEKEEVHVEAASADVPETADRTEEALPTGAPVRKRSSQGERRTVLLKALRPYVSPERAKAIDTVVALTGVLEMMKGR